MLFLLSRCGPALQFWSLSTPSYHRLEPRLFDQSRASLIGDLCVCLVVKIFLVSPPARERAAERGICRGGAPCRPARSGLETESRMAESGARSGISTSALAPATASAISQMCSGVCSGNSLRGYGDSRPSFAQPSKKQVWSRAGPRRIRRRRWACRRSDRRRSGCRRCGPARPGAGASARPPASN